MMDSPNKKECNSGHIQQLSTQLLFMQRFGLYCDTAFTTGDHRMIYAHSCILATVCSNLTATLNQQQYHNPMSNVIDMSNYDGDVVSEMVAYVYTGAFNNSHAPDLPQLFKELGIQWPRTAETRADSSVKQAVTVEENVKLSIDKAKFSVNCGQSSPHFEADLAVHEPDDSPFVCCECCMAFSVAADLLHHLNNSHSYLECNSNVMFSSKLRTSKVPIKVVKTELIEQLDNWCVSPMQSFEQTSNNKVIDETVSELELEADVIDTEECSLSGDQLGEKVKTPYGFLYMCSGCPAVFTKPNRLRTHRLTVHEYIDDSDSIHGSQNGTPDAGQVVLRKSKLRMKTCEICHKSMEKGRRFDAHMNRHLGLKPYRCEECGKKFSNVECLASHKRTHQAKRGTYSCSYCDKSYYAPSLLKEHLNMHTGERPYICETCGHSLQNRSGFRRHCLLHIRDSLKKKPGAMKSAPAAVRSAAPSNSDRNSSGSVSVHLHINDQKEAESESVDIHKDSTDDGGNANVLEDVIAKLRGALQHCDTVETPYGKLYTCTECSAVFTAMLTFRKHRLVVHKDETIQALIKTDPDEIKPASAARMRKPMNQLTCEICQKTLDRGRRFRAHMNKHLGLKPYRCDICGKAFFNEECLVKHRVIHKESRGHDCTFCSKSFDKESLLQDHLNSHTGERPYVCETCGQDFGSKSVFTCHVQRHKNESILCEICNKSFNHRKNLSAHMKIHSSDLPHECSDCGRRFRELSSLRVHYLSVHTRQFPVECEHCGQGFVNSYKLKLHVLKQHSPDVRKPFSCDICMKEYVERYLLEKHKQQHHSHSDAHKKS